MGAEEVRSFTGMPVHEYRKLSGSSLMTNSVGPAELGHLIKAAATHPDITKFTWEQYTPYFNDGEVCEFNVHELHVCTRLTDEIDFDEDPWSYGVGGHPQLATTRYDYAQHRYVENPQALTDAARVIDELSRGLQQAEITLLDWFGDHAQITVRASGITVDEYDHD